MSRTAKRHHRSITRQVLVACSLLSLLGCTRVITIEPPVDSSPAPYNADADARQFWWDVGFGIARDSEGDTLWHVDTLLADQVCRPVLAELGPRMELWRFHRRAAHDERGHLFRFYFYSDLATAELVNERIADSTLVSWLSDQGVVKRTFLAQTSEPIKPGLGDRSDPDWPVELKNSWPYYGMGVSQTWLALIAQVLTLNPPSETLSPENLLSYYKQTNDRVSTLWREQAQHAYLHHLSALFGYQPVLIRKSAMTRF